MGRLYRVFGLIGLATLGFGRAAKADPAADALFLKAKAAKEAGQYREAMGFLRGAEALAPNDPQVHLKLGYVLMGLQDRRGAAEQFFTVTRLAGGTALAHDAERALGKLGAKAAAPSETPAPARPRSPRAPARPNTSLPGPDSQPGGDQAGSSEAPGNARSKEPAVAWDRAAGEKSILPADPNAPRIDPSLIHNVTPLKADGQSEKARHNPVIALVAALSAFVLTASTVLGTVAFVRRRVRVAEEAAAEAAVGREVAAALRWRRKLVGTAAPSEPAAPAAQTRSTDRSQPADAAANR